MTEKLLGPTLEAKEKKLVEQYITAFSARNRLIFVDQWLAHVEEQKADPNVSLLVKPIVEHAIVIYCSAFNDSRTFSRFSHKKIFSATEQRRIHDFLMEYRNKELAHMEDVFTSAWLRTDVSHRKPLLAGTGSPLVNELVPSTPYWTQFRNQILHTTVWLKEKEISLKSSISDFLNIKDEEWFDNLPDAPVHEPPF